MCRGCSPLRGFACFFSVKIGTYTSCHCNNFFLFYRYILYLHKTPKTWKNNGVKGSISLMCYLFFFLSLFLSKVKGKPRHNHYWSLSKANSMYKIGLCVAACSSDAACVDLSRGRKPSCLQSEETTWIPSLILLLVGFHSCDMSKCEEIQTCLCRKD